MLSSVEQKGLSMKGQDHVENSITKFEERIQKWEELYLQSGFKDRIIIVAHSGYPSMDFLNAHDDRDPNFSNLAAELCAIWHAQPNYIPPSVL